MDDRREDWHNRVDQNLAGLNAGQLVWEREIKTIRRLLAETDNLLRGDPEKDTDGLMARLHTVENDINMIKALVLEDKAGNRGLVARVKTLESRERTSDNRWKFATAVVVAVISLAGLVMTNWGRIETFVNRKSTDPVDLAIERARHPKARHRHVVIRPQPTDPDPED